MTETTPGPGPGSTEQTLGALFVNASRDLSALVTGGFASGIGFTVSLLIAELSFVDEQLLTDAKLGIIFASVLAGILGFVVLRRAYAAERA